MNIDPTDPVVIFRRALGMAIIQHGPPHHRLESTLRSLFKSPGERACALHFLNGRRTLSTDKWNRFKRSTTWQPIPAEVKARVESAWEESHREPRPPIRSKGYEAASVVADRLVSLCDRVECEFATMDELRAEIRRVLSRRPRQRL